MLCCFPFKVCQKNTVIENKCGENLEACLGAEAGVPWKGEIPGDGLVDSKGTANALSISLQNNAEELLELLEMKIILNI